MRLNVASTYDRSYSFLTAVPTAELEPLTDTYVQADEVNKYCTRPTGFMLTRVTGFL